MKIILIAWLMFIFYHYISHFVTPIPFPPAHITMGYIIQMMVVILGFIWSFILAFHLAEQPSKGFLFGLFLWILFYWI